jgi:hypothetical protein
METGKEIQEGERRTLPAPRRIAVPDWPKPDERPLEVPDWPVRKEEPARVGGGA